MRPLNVAFGVELIVTTALPPDRGVAVKMYCARSTRQEGIGIAAHPIASAALTNNATAVHHRSTQGSPPHPADAHLSEFSSRRRCGNRLSSVSAGVHSTDKGGAVRIRHGEQQRVRSWHALAAHRCYSRDAINCAGSEPGDGTVDFWTGGGDAALIAGGGAELDVVRGDRAA